MTNRIRKTVLSAIIAGMVASGAPAVQADTSSYSFGKLLSGSYAPGATFASLSVSSNDNKTFQFSLTSNDLNNLFSSGAFIGSLAVDTVQNVGDGKRAIDLPSVSIAPGGGVKKIEVFDGAAPGGKKWDFGYDLAEGRKDRLTGLETVSWTSTFEKAVTFSGSKFALHVQGLSDREGSSAWYIPSPIPEPESYAMMLAGLGLLAFVARRRKNTQG